MEKVCIKCNELKSIKNFGKYEKNKYRNICKTCLNKQRRNIYYPISKEKIIKQTKQNRILLHEKVDKLKSYPCKDCGIQYEPFCMDFDHLRDKILPISKMIHENYSFDKIKLEIEKCDLVCVLCHRNRTYFRQKLVKENKNLSPTRIRNKKVFNNAKLNKPCEICHKLYNPWQMEFDHLESEKKYKSVSILVTANYSIKTIEREIDKCQLLCSLCHRRKTAQNWRNRKNV